MKNIILADNQAVTNLGIKCIIQQQMYDIQYDFHIAQSKKDLIAILSEFPNSYIILDYTLFDFSSSDELLILSQRYPSSNWLLFSDDLSDKFLIKLAGNNFPFSILLKNNSFDEIIEGIDALINSSIFICKGIKAHILTLNKNLEKQIDYSLTQTEKEILKEIAFGKTTKEIAFDRNLSFHTIITHRKNIFRKLQVNNIHEATKYAFKAGIVDFSEYYI